MLFGEVTIYEPEEYATAVAQRLISFASQHGTVNIALSGGSTPQAIFKVLAAGNSNLDNVRFFWADERYVPYDSPDSNFGEAWRLWLSSIRPDREDLFPFAVERDSPQVVAQNYARIVPQNGLDLVLLGVGEDGHTASIFPGDEETRRTDLFAAATVAPFKPYQRLTLTPRYLNLAKHVWFLATGERKRLILKQTASGDQTLPVAWITKPNIHWYLDEPASQV
ncbi:MAG: 6-phosphogluconolactonase [Armatimonadetes bacterium]|nr:6-phosphogluconolactonase [Armatimonadota bacterium]